MCDYSLMAVPNRLAREGEDLVVHRFPTGSLGLATPGDVKRMCEPRESEVKGLWTTIVDFLNPPGVEPVCAVCIPPGARLELKDIPRRLQVEYNVGEVETVTFTQITASANAYRDAVRFPKGREVRLQELREGQRVKVLDLSMASEMNLDALRLEQLEHAERFQ